MSRPLSAARLRRSASDRVAKTDVEDYVSRTQHLARALAALLTLLPVCVAAQVPAIPSAQAIVALVKASPQLRIDETVFASAYDAQTHPYIVIPSAPGGTVGGYLVPEGAHGGALSDGTVVIAVPLDSGGSGGVFTQVLFAQTGGAFAYAGYIDSAGHLDVEIRNGVVVATMPYYGDNSPNCCPSKRIVQTYTIRGGTLVKLSEERSDMPKGE